MISVMFLDWIPLTPSTPVPPGWLLALARGDSSGGRPDRIEAEDGELMRRIRDRDGTALAALYDRHAAAVFAVCLRMLDRSDAEEVVGDVFWHVWERPERYEVSRGSVQTYLMLLGRSRAADRLRSSGRRRKILDDTGQDAVRETLHDGAPRADPFDRTAGAELRRHVTLALSQLDAGQRQAIELSFYGAMSHSEIAEALGQPLGTVKTRIRQGLIHLRDSLDAFYGAGERA